jgi:hypothetical protein
MATTQDPAPGMDFWATLGVGEEAPEREEGTDGVLASADPHAQDDWAAMFSSWQAPSGEQPEAPPPPSEPETKKVRRTKPAKGKQANRPQTVQFEQPKSQPQPAEPPEPEPSQPPQAPRAEQPVVEVRVAGAAPDADADWLAAERIADSLRPRLSAVWLDLLTRHTEGDRVMARRVYNVLNGFHQLGELWRDRTVNEVHIRGTEVTVYGPLGMRQAPSFSGPAVARRAVEAMTAAQEQADAVVTRLGDSIVVRRRREAAPDAAALVAAGILTEEQLARIREALAALRAVTLTGPAAPVVMRGLATLIPAGSRVFQGAGAVLPPGCIAAKNPLEADYVVGVRPGAVAEDMAAAGQLGALIANPETRFQADLRCTVAGRSTAPGRLSFAG